MSDIAFMPAGVLARLITGKELLPVDVVDVVLSRIDVINGQLAALSHHDPEQLRPSSTSSSTGH